jgi:ribosome-binding protein aMBF1 (putative translation factor)
MSKPVKLKMQDEELNLTVISEVLESLREVDNLSVEGLAKKLGVSLTVIQAIEGLNKDEDTEALLAFIEYISALVLEEPLEKVLTL